GVEIKPGKPYTLTQNDYDGRLRLTQATLGDEVGKGEKGTGRKKCVLQCSVEDKDPVYLCAMVPEQSETCHLELEFDEEVTFSVIGQRSIHLAGYYVPDAYGEDMSDSDSGSDSLQGSDEDGFLEDDDGNNMVMMDQMITDSEDDGSDYDSESDDEEMAYNQRRGKSSVVIEEIQEDDKPSVGEVQRGSNKKQSRENGDKSQLQLVVRTPAESLESEDEDGFPVSFSESKKSSESVSKKKGGKDKEASNEDRKRKSGAITDRGDSSGDVKVENDGASKKKKKTKDKSTAMDNGKVKKEGKEIKQQDSQAGPVSAQQKKTKSTSVSEAGADEQSAKKNNVHKDGEDVAAQEGNKKKNKKKKAQDTNRSENQSSTGLVESESKEPRQTRTFANGMIIQEMVLGKPDGKKATNGKKVAVRYVGKLKNGTIFDSNVSGRPFEFRLGVGQVIKGWDVGVNGMRVGDKRRLTIPPSMGYGSDRVGKIPQNSTLIFDVELVNVK
ncbi:Peptidyl-prolyl cis-trans isomerase FKBP53, partial [Dichanthelium oligosanthes]